MNDLEPLLQRYHVGLRKQLHEIFTKHKVLQHVRMKTVTCEETIAGQLLCIGELGFFSVTDFVADPLRIFSLLEAVAMWNPTLAFRLTIHVRIIYSALFSQTLPHFPF